MPTKRFTSSQKKRNERLKQARLRIGSMTPDSDRRSRSHSGRLAALKRDMQSERFKAYLKRHPSYEEKKKAKAASKKTASKKTSIKKTAIKKTATKKTASKKTASKKTATKKTTTKAVSKRNFKSSNPYTRKHRPAPVVSERGNEDNLTIFVKSKNMNTLGEQLKNKGFIQVRSTRTGTLFKHPAIEQIEKKAEVTNSDIDKLTAQIAALSGLDKVEQQLKNVNKKQKIDNNNIDDLIGNLESVKVASDSIDNISTMMDSLRA